MKKLGLDSPERKICCLIFSETAKYIELESVNKTTKQLAILYMWIPTVVDIDIITNGRISCLINESLTRHQLLPEDFTHIRKQHFPFDSLRFTFGTADKEYGWRYVGTAIKEELANFEAGMFGGKFSGEMVGHTQKITERHLISQNQYPTRMAANVTSIPTSNGTPQWKSKGYYTSKGWTNFIAIPLVLKRITGQVGIHRLLTIECISAL